VKDLNNLHFFGYRGEALASIIDLSAGVEFYSKTSTQGSAQPYYRKFKNGRPVGTTHQVSESKRPSPGLTVIVHNLLSKLPVRQKRIDSKPEIEAGDIKQSLEQIYLMNPSLLLVFELDGRRLFRTCPVTSVTDGFKQVFSHRLKDSTIHECFFNFDCYFFQGWFTRDTYHSKNLQFVYVNKRFVARNKIHRAVNSNLSELIGIGLGATKSSSRNSRGLNVSNGSRSSPRSAQDKEKYPIFLLNIQAPFTEYDMTLEPKKSLVEFRHWERVEKGLEGLVLKFKTELATENKGVVVNVKMGGGGRQKLLGNLNDCGGDMGKAITTHDMRRAVHSRVAKRERGPGSPVFDSEGEESPMAGPSANAG
jgi:DNA mismatch repair protein MLH3